MKMYAYWATPSWCEPYLYCTDRKLTGADDLIFAGEFEIDNSKIIPLTTSAMVDNLEAEKTKIRAEMTAKITAIDDRIKNLLALPGAA